MSDTRDPETDQPAPQPQEGVAGVHDAILKVIDTWGLGSRVSEAICEGIEGRRELGLRKYKTVLQPHNGRDALVDAWEEALDLLCYLYQLYLEGDDTRNQIAQALSILHSLVYKRMQRGDAELS